MTKLMNIRRSAACAECGEPLAAGVQAYWDSTGRVVRCVACGSSEESAPPSPGIRTTEVNVTQRHEDIAGGSCGRDPSGVDRGCLVGEISLRPTNLDVA